MKKPSINKIKGKLTKLLKNPNKSKKIDESKIKDKTSFNEIKKAYQQELKELKACKNVKFADKKFNKSDMTEAKDYEEIVSSFKSSSNLLKSTFQSEINPLLEKDNIDTEEKEKIKIEIHDLKDLIVNFADAFRDAYVFRRKFKQLYNEYDKLFKEEQTNYETAKNKLKEILKKENDKIKEIEEYVKGKQKINSTHLREYKETFLDQNKDNSIKDFISSENYLSDCCDKTLRGKGPLNFKRETAKQLGMILTGLKTPTKKERKKAEEDLETKSNNELKIMKEIIKTTQDFSETLENYINNAYNELIQIQKNKDNLASNKTNGNNNVAELKNIFNKKIEESMESKPSAQRKVGKLTKERLEKFENKK